MRWFALKAYKHYKQGKYHLCKYKNGWKPICGEHLLLHPDNFDTIERKRPNMIQRCSKCERKRKVI